MVNSKMFAISLLFSPSSKSIFTDRSKLIFLLWIIFVFFCFVFVMFSCLFIVALWSPAEKRLTSWLSCMWCFIVFCHFPMRCPGSGVVFNYIDSWSLPSFLLWNQVTQVRFSPQVAYRFSLYDNGALWHWRQKLGRPYMHWPDHEIARLTW